MNEIDFITGMNAIDVIKGAREILAAGHWRKGALEDGVGGYCIVGALQRLAGLNWFFAGTHLEAQLEAQLGRKLSAGRANGAMLAEYNDDPATTLQDMLNLIDKTLAGLGAL